MPIESNQPPAQPFPANAPMRSPQIEQMQNIQMPGVMPPAEPTHAAPSVQGNSGPQLGPNHQVYPNADPMRSSVAQPSTDAQPLPAMRQNLGSPALPPISTMNLKAPIQQQPDPARGMAANEQSMGAPVMPPRSMSMPRGVESLDSPQAPTPKELPSVSTLYQSPPRKPEPKQPAAAPPIEADSGPPIQAPVTILPPRN